MKRSLVIFFSLLSFVGQAQEVSTAVGIETGFAVSSLAYRRTAFRSQNLSRVNLGGSLHIGVTAHVQIGSEFAFRPSIYYKFHALNIGRAIYDMEVPLNILYTVRSRGGSSFFIGTGPNINYTFKVTESTQNGVQPIRIGSKPFDYIRAFSLSANFKLGWQKSSGFTYNMYTNIVRYNRSNDPEFILRSSDIIGFTFGYLLPTRLAKPKGL